MAAGTRRDLRLWCLGGGRSGHTTTVEMASLVSRGCRPLKVLAMAFLWLHSLCYISGGAGLAASSGLLSLHKLSQK